jgi:hypothetical protein
MAAVTMAAFGMPIDLFAQTTVYAPSAQLPSAEFFIYSLIYLAVFIASLIVSLRFAFRPINERMYRDAAVRSLKMTFGSLGALLVVSIITFALGAREMFSWAVAILEPITIAGLIALPAVGIAKLRNRSSGDSEGPGPGTSAPPALSMLIGLLLAGALLPVSADAVFEKLITPVESQVEFEINKR